MKTYEYEGYNYTIQQKRDGTYNISIEDSVGTPIFDDDDFRSLSNAIDCSKHMIDDIIFRKGD